MIRTTYGRVFRSRTGRLVRYVYRNREKVGMLVIAGVAVLDEDREPDLFHVRPRVVPFTFRSK